MRPYGRIPHWTGAVIVCLPFSRYNNGVLALLQA